MSRNNFFTSFLLKYTPNNQWNKLILYTRYNNNIVYKDHMITETEGYFINGIYLSRKNDCYILTIRTVEDNEEKISCDIKFNLNGDYIIGKVNCFALGYMKCDKEYVEELLEELNEKDKIEWDVIE